MHFLVFPMVAHIFLEMLKFKDFFKSIIICHICKEIPPNEDIETGPGCFLFMK